MKKFHLIMKKDEIDSNKSELEALQKLYKGRLAILEVRDPIEFKDNEEYLWWPDTIMPKECKGKKNHTEALKLILRDPNLSLESSRCTAKMVTKFARAYKSPLKRIGTIGLIGFGKVGRLIANELVKAGIKGVVYDVIKQQGPDGITFHTSVAKVAHNADLIIIATRGGSIVPIVNKFPSGTHVLNLPHVNPWDRLRLRYLCWRRGVVFTSVRSIYDRNRWSGSGQKRIKITKKELVLAKKAKNWMLTKQIIEKLMKSAGASAQIIEKSMKSAGASAEKK